MKKQAIATTEQSLQTAKRPLVMKSGLVHWLQEDTAAKIEHMLANQQAHGFIKISELGITINTADIGDGVLTLEKYDELVKRKSGMWQCPEGNWHEKKILNCTCLSDRLADERRKREQAAREQEYAPPTPEQAELNRERTKKTGELLVLRGIITALGRKVRRSTLNEFEESGEEMKVKGELIIEEDVL